MGNAVGNALRVALLRRRYADNLLFQIEPRSAGRAAVKSHIRLQDVAEINVHVRQVQWAPRPADNSLHARIAHVMRMSNRHDDFSPSNLGILFERNRFNRLFRIDFEQRQIVWNQDGYQFRLVFFVVKSLDKVVNCFVDDVSACQHVAVRGNKEPGRNAVPVLRLVNKVFRQLFVRRVFKIARYKNHRFRKVVVCRGNKLAAKTLNFFRSQPRLNGDAN